MKAWESTGGWGAACWEDGGWCAPSVLPGPFMCVDWAPVVAVEVATVASGLFIADAVVVAVVEVAVVTAVCSTVDGTLEPVSKPSVVAMVERGTLRPGGPEGSAFDSRGSPSATLSKNPAVLGFKPAWGSSDLPCGLSLMLAHEDPFVAPAFQPDGSSARPNDPKLKDISLSAVGAPNLPRRRLWSWEFWELSRSLGPLRVLAVAAVDEGSGVDCRCCCGFECGATPIASARSALVTSS